MKLFFSRSNFGFTSRPSLRLAAMTAALMVMSPAWAFVSGSTGADGPFNPTVNTVVQLPPSGVLNYTIVNIPNSITVTFIRNATNTPAVILATGDVTVAGTLDIRGKKSADTGSAGTGNLGDDGLPGEAGAGGYFGGAGGRTGSTIADRIGGNGQGPGGGGRGQWGPNPGNTRPLGGAGAGYSSIGANNAYNESVPGVTYGSSALLPLIGGSGGGGGSSGVASRGSGGGGGGGAILIAATGTVTISGSILASGGAAGSTDGTGCGGAGGGGSGGAIRVVATTIAGAGTVSALGGDRGVEVCTQGYGNGGIGGEGRIRLEADTYTRTGITNPIPSLSAPGQVFVAGVPTLAILSVAGTTAPTSPTGNADITLPATTVNPVAVVFQTTGVPVGNNVKLTVTPAYGAPVSAVSNAITGTTTLGTATVPIALPTGPSTLLAQTTYTITVAMGQALSQFAQNETVERVAIKAIPGKANQYYLVTVSGKEFEVPLARLVGII